MEKNLVCEVMESGSFGVFLKTENKKTVMLFEYDVEEEARLAIYENDKDFCDVVVKSLELLMSSASRAIQEIDSHLGRPTSNNNIYKRKMRW